MSRRWTVLIEFLTSWLPFRYVEQHFEVGDETIRIRTPKFLSRMYDEQAPSDRHPGISEAAFPLVGIVWPSGEVLAELMTHTPTEGRRILEIGCGMGLPSLVLAKSGADITTMDIHPVVGAYLADNARLNNISPPTFFEASWSDNETDLGAFDLIIGSDLLYEPRHSQFLAGFIDRHGSPGCEVLIVDPGRGQAENFIEGMTRAGFQADMIRPGFMDSLGLPYQLQVHRFRR